MSARNFVQTSLGVLDAGPFGKKTTQFNGPVVWAPVAGTLKNGFETIKRINCKFTDTRATLSLLPNNRYLVHPRSLFNIFRMKEMPRAAPPSLCIYRHIGQIADPR